MSAGSAARRGLLALLASALLVTSGVAATAGSPPLVRFSDPQAGLSVSYPRGWHHPARLTRLIYPRERLALASYPLPRNDTVGECQAQHSLEQMPPDGALIYLLEHRPLLGRVWAEIRRRDFPPRPRRFRIERAGLQRKVGCYAGPSYARRFRDAERPFDLFVALGERASDARIGEVEAILNSLRFRRLPPPPPDPYAGWPLLTTESGDSLRPPPAWPASATFMPRRLPRPRPLFFASNLPLPGLPRRLVTNVKRLPAPFPAQALDAFPPQGVLLWVIEEPKGPPSAGFPAIRRGWRASDFQAAASGPPERWPQLRWLRAGGAFRGYRFSLWLVSGAQASKADLERALESAASLALSACLRDRPSDCPQR